MEKPGISNIQLIFTSDEIILLKIGENIIIDKSNEHDYFINKFECSKLYLSYISSINGIKLFKNYFFRGNDKSMIFKQTFPIDTKCENVNIEELNREEIESIFNSENYDAMYIFDGNGQIRFLSNKKENIVIGKNIIPTDKEIIEIEFNDRISEHNVASLFVDENVIGEVDKNTNTIEQLKNIKLYGSELVDDFIDMMLVVKNGQFELKLFKIDFIEKNRFRLVTKNIAIIEPTIEEIAKYLNIYNIDTKEPVKLDDSILKTTNMEPKTNDGIKRLIKNKFKKN